MSRPGRSRTVARQSTLGIAALLAVVLCGLVNYFGWKYFSRWDWTSSQVYSLSEKSKNILAGLDREIQVTVFMDPQADGYQQALELLARYEAASPRISVEEVDPARDLARAQELLEQGSVNVVIFDSGDDRRLVDTADLIEYDYSGMQFGQEPAVRAYKGEQEFTAAILGLAEGGMRRAVVTAGHGEADIDNPGGAGLTGVKALLERDNFEVVRWESLSDPTVPENTELLIVAGPKTSFTPPEAQAIGDYLDRGGRLLALLDPQFSPLGGLTPSGLEQVLAENGVEVGGDIVIDPAGAVPFFGAETLLAGRFGTHPAAKILSDAGISVLLPLAQSVTPVDVEGARSDVLLETSDQGWGETDLERLDQVALDDHDRAGPVGLAVAVEGTGESADAVMVDPADQPRADPMEETAAPTMRLVVVGDSEFATDNQIASSGNAVLLSNLVNWLAQRESALAIPPRTPEQTRLNLTQSQVAGARWLTVAIIPLTMLAAGFAVYWRRRR